jgi:hypothetical protein
VRGLRPFPQDPTACSTTSPTTDPVFPTPRGGTHVLRPARPNWSAFHP